MSDEWKPMSEAPRDGTPIRVRWPDGWNDMEEVVFWGDWRGPDDKNWLSLRDPAIACGERNMTGWLAVSASKLTDA